MSGTVFTVCGLIIGVMITAAGLYYLAKSKDDADSRKIYGVTSMVGIGIVIGLIAKALVFGL